MSNMYLHSGASVTQLPGGSLSTVPDVHVYYLLSQVLGKIAFSFFTFQSDITGQYPRKMEKKKGQVGEAKLLMKIECILACVRLQT